MIINGGANIPVDLTYDSPKGEVPTVAIFMQESPTNTRAWAIRVYAMTDEGRFEIGRYNTTPANRLASAGYSTNRLSAAGTIPGATGYFVTIQTDQPQVCEVFLKANDCCTSAFGLVKIEPTV